jgi:hypothetical protein
MPIKVLFVEDDKLAQDSLKSMLQHNLGIQYSIIDDFSKINTELSNSNYTHLIAKTVVNNSSILDLEEFILIPTLVIGSGNYSNTTFNSTQPPLTYDKLFAFLCEKTIISNNTLEKYAMGDLDFMTQMKGHIIEEFELNVNELPELIKSNNLPEIKSKIHQLVSKFSLLEMINTYDLSREIDSNILEQPELQIANTHQLLVDMEIALTQLK